MRIERVEVDGFGRFHDARWDLPDGLTVLVGENEAGKSTLLNLIRALVFGFESTRDGRTWYPPLAGGRRGGRLTLRSSAGERWLVERHGDRGGSGALVVRAPSGNVGGQETLDRLLHGADRDLFMNIFAFGLGELQAIGSLSGEGVRSRIYGAGSGLGGISALDLERRLRAEQDASYRPRGRDTSLETLNGLLSRIDELHAEIARLERQPAEYEAARSELAAVERRRQEITRERLAAAERAERARRLLLAQPECAHVDQLEAQLAEGNAADDALPRDAVVRLDRRVSARETAGQRLRDVDRQLERLEARLSALALDDRLPAIAVEAAALREERPVHERREAARLAALAEAERHQATLVEAARRAGWTAEQLLQADDSVAALEATREHERALSAARSGVDDRRRRLESLRDEVERHGRSAVDGDDPGQLDARAAALDALVRHDIRSAAIGEARARPRVRQGAAVAAAVAAAAALIGGVLVDAPVIGILVGAALAGISVALLVMPSPQAPPPAGGAEARATLLERAGLPPDADPATASAARDGIAVARARSALAAEEGRRREERAGLAERAERDHAAAVRELELASAAWAAWLRERSLRAELTPEAARATLSLAEGARRAASSVTAAEQRAAVTEAEMNSFEERLVKLLADVGREVPPAGSARLAALARLVSDLGVDAGARRQRAELEEQRAELLAARDSLLAAREEAAGALASLLSELGAADEEDLRRRAARAEERRALHAALRERRAALVAIAGGEPAVAALAAEARGVDPAAAQAQREAAVALVERLDAEEREALTRGGALGERIAALETSEELGERRQELAELQGRAEAEARRWAVRAVTLRLLSETRQRYERERQPAVVRDAERHFQRITGGRWQRIIAPPGEPSIEVESEGGEARRPEELSRGTAEQLYLALRFGLIEQFARHAEPLPVVMDEVLVNFDPLRAERTAAAIGDLATRHQVLYFTCQPPMAKLLDPAGGRTIALG